MVFTGFFSGCDEQNRNQGLNENTSNENTSNNNTSLQENQPPKASCSANTTYEIGRAHV
jgi:hypothetical protein